MITVIGAGSGKKENLSLEAFRTIKNAKNVILKTAKMPIAKLLENENINYSTLDAFYEEAEDFDDLNQKIKAHLSGLTDPVYVVHGSALDDTSVRLLEDVKIIPGVSVADCMMAFTGISSDAKAYTTTEILNGVLPSTHTDSIVTCIDSAFLASEIKCILADIFGDEYQVNFYTEDFDGVQSKKDIMLYELDMQQCYNHTSSISIKKPDFESVYKYDCFHLIDIMEKLCSKDGCPWDSKQTHSSLRPYLIEEAYEVADAIDKDDPYSLYDELGDVLYQIVFHACIGKKCGEFDFNDITDAISRKMIHRHPQIFSDKKIDGSINDVWEEMKKEEKGLNSTYEVMEDIPAGMAALMRAQKILNKAEKAGINYQDKQQTINNIVALINKSDSLSDADLGDILFEAVKLCCIHGINPELALHRKIRSFIEESAKKPLK